MKITDILKPSSILVHHHAGTKNDVLDAMLAVLSSSGQITHAEEVRKAVYDRENIMSTGIGKGFALPHGKTNFINDTVGAFMTLDTPVDFHSLDQQPVNIVFMLVGRENTVGTHLRLLSRISRLMNNDLFRQKVMSAADADQVLQLFIQEEEDML
jgi:fructose-specific phosphotransferase system IIA component